MRDDIVECPACGGSGEIENDNEESEDPASILECWRCGGAGEICRTRGNGLDDCKCSPEEAE